MNSKIRNKINIKLFRHVLYIYLFYITKKTVVKLNLVPRFYRRRRKKESYQRHNLSRKLPSVKTVTVWIRGSVIRGERERERDGDLHHPLKMSSEKKQLIVVAEGTAALGPYWQTIVSDYLHKIIRLFLFSSPPPLSFFRFFHKSP